MSKIIKEALQGASFQLKQAGLIQPRKEAEALFCAAAQLPLAWVYAHPEASVSDEVDVLFKSWVKRRSQGEPYAYICGEREFMGLLFDVTPSVLIPRPETELLVETVIQALKLHKQANILEIGAGSGAIATALAVLLPTAHVTAVDISAKALEVAACNTRKHQVDARVRLLLGDLYAPVTKERFDIVLSNPPYIPTADIAALETTVKDYEPHTALDGGPDGLHFYRRLTRELSVLADVPPFYAVEVGMGQADAVCELFYAAGYKLTRQILDLAGISRVVIAENQKTSVI